MQPNETALETAEDSIHQNDVHNTEQTIDQHYTSNQEQQNEISKSEKSRKHIHDTLKLKKQSYMNSQLNAQEIANRTLNELLKIYESTIQPLEDAYRFSDLNKDSLLGAEIKAKPLILLIGPWSTGKTSLINYLLGLENSPQKLHTGAEPTTSDFFIIQNGPQYRTIKGMQLITDQRLSFASLERLGLHFLERLKGVELQSPLLELVTLVDTPGILENKKQQERGYPFNEVTEWFIQRASIIYLVFDPTKLEVGSELEGIFNMLKGHDGKVRLLLNKADTVSQQELMKVYGALFWSLGPLIHSVEPPRVYVGSFWSNTRTDHPLAKLFLEEEMTLLEDLNQIIENQVENKIAYVRQHASLVRLHALTIDAFIKVYEKNKSYLFSNDELMLNIIEDPVKYNVFQNLLLNNEVSKFDLPKPETYIEFFKNNPLEMFKPLSKYCSFFSACYLDTINKALNEQLPKLLNTMKLNRAQGFCTKDSCTKS
ncbi:sarcalumenin-like isoform X2 [Physella acuta]|uniref:sarcalumenin-like isoform X2 n=1 Tax=Physella acuta TaxID=109671 RepID=UPI0027DC9B93|nr:sarcalumenin-like isoform X2 [Physella acuta]